MLESLRSLDLSILLALNGFAGRSEILDGMVRLISNNYIAKGVFPMLLLWGLWYSGTRYGTQTREKLLGVLFVAIGSIFVGRALALLLPFRERPIHAETLPVNDPIGMSTDLLETWNSMPSDHAVLYFALAVGLGLVSSLIGAIALAHAIVIVALPRIYLGLHFPSDIAVGAVIGAAIAFLLVPVLTRLLFGLDVRRSWTSWPYFFYPAMFFVTFQTASMFDSLRNAISPVMKLLLG